MKKIIVIPILLLGIFLVTGCGNKKNNSVKLDDNGSTNVELKIEEVSFSNINKVYENGITTISASMKNLTKETLNFEVEVILKDNSGKVVKSLKQNVEDLRTDRKQTLKVGIVGNYSDINNIEFKVVK